MILEKHWTCNWYYSLKKICFPLWFDLNVSLFLLTRFNQGIVQVPKDTVFNDQVSTSGLRCVEMRERRPWRHHIDYFGVAATAYCLLVGKYLKVFILSIFVSLEPDQNQVKKSKATGRWEPKEFKPRRGWQVIFHS